MTIAAVIEVASDNVIDCGVMDDDSYHLFVDADTDKGIKKIRWFEEIESKNFVFRPKPKTRYWLILSNVYSKSKVSVAYNVSFEEAAA